MDYSRLSEEQRGSCVELIGQLQGGVMATKLQARREGILNIGYIAANQDAQNVLSAELSALLDSYPKPDAS